MKFDNGYRYYVLDRFIPISRCDTYEDALLNVTKEHQVIRHLDAKTPYEPEVRGAEEGR